MKKVLTLSREEARLLYNLLSGHSITNRSDNRKRFKFLDVIEKFVFDFEDQLKVFAGKKPEDIQDELTVLTEGTEEFVFSDREIFAVVKDMFEKCFSTGSKVTGPMGKTTISPLTGRNAKIYVDLENRFADVKEIKEDIK